jgi:CheY-like chemotaxis protein
MALNQLLMKTVLDDFGFERDIADNGKIAIEKLAKETYDIILMDLQMPVMNGFEATTYIRNVMKSSIPIIALTADVTTVDLDKCKSVGMNDYLAKPIDERLLYSKIVSLVKKPLLSRTFQEDEMNHIKAMKYANMDYLIQRTKANPTLIMEMLSAYLEQTPTLVMEMKQSYKEKDWKILESILHKMIPSFSIMGIDVEYESMAKKILEYASIKQDNETLADFIFQIENICARVCEELTEELNNLKK